jgi:hypothetical protein
MENSMTLHRQSRSTDYGLASVALAAALMIAAPIGAASAAGVGGAGVGNGAGAASASAGQASAANGSGYNPSETDCVTIAQQPGRYAPDELSACGLTAPIGGYGYYQPRG